MSDTIKILVVEDNPDDFLLLEEILGSSKEIEPEVFHADKLEHALQIAAKNEIDVVFLDLQLPDSYGLDTFSAFNQQFPLMPVIIMTGIQDQDIALKAVRNGAQDFLHKGGYSSSILARTIRYAIERHQLVEDLERTKDSLQQSLDESKRRENELQAVLRGARAVLEQSDFDTTARKVFDICSETIGSTSGYVALLSENGEENEVLFLESGGLPCSVNPELPMPIRGLRKTAYDNNSTVYDNDFMNSKWITYMPKGHVRLKNVMFSPLVLDGKTIGIIGLANKKGDFTPDDAKLATGFGELAAIALQNSRNLDKRDMAEKHNERLIEELKAAIENIKQLKGLLPICSHCKKIRDDGGYWNQIEAYVRKYSEAEFSHSICPDCARIHYPDLAIYGEEGGDSKENRVARILIMEDDEQIRSVLGEILRSEGHETTLASNGKEGLRIFKEAGADVIITDIIMPDKEGLETIMELRENHPDVKIVAISGGGISDAESYLNLAEKMGASCTLSKPFQREELLQVVNNLLAD